jgi:hypothetical protein
MAILTLAPSALSGILFVMLILGPRNPPIIQNGEKQSKSVRAFEAISPFNFKFLPVTASIFRLDANTIHHC